MKSGFCYSDVKSFIPEVIAMALVALWFSSNKSSAADKLIKLRRQALVQQIEQLPEILEHLLNDLECNQQYSKISKVLKNQQNLFILAKGSGNFVGNFMAQKFL